MFYKYIYLFLLFLSTYTKAQEQLYIHFNPQKGKIGNIYILEPSGIFVLNNRAKLQAVIIGNFNENEVVPIINDYKNNYIPLRFQVQNVQILSYQLYEINYPEKYATKGIEFRNYPISVNHYSLSYFDKYYDKEIVKGKIKSVGNIKLKYNKEYPLCI